MASAAWAVLVKRPRDSYGEDEGGEGQWAKEVGGERGGGGTGGGLAASLGSDQGTDNCLRRKEREGGGREARVRR
jgi:hypothetical protein